MRLKCNLSSAFAAGNIQNCFKAQMSSYSDYIGFSKHKTHKVGGILWSWCKHLGPFSFHWCEIFLLPLQAVTVIMQLHTVFGNFTCRQHVRLRITGNNHPVNVEWSDGDKNKPYIFQIYLMHKKPKWKSMEKWFLHIKPPKLQLFMFGGTGLCPAYWVLNEIWWHWSQTLSMKLDPEVPQNNRLFLGIMQLYELLVLFLHTLLR